MPAFGDSLSHEDIVAVIGYLKSLWGDKQFRGAVKRDSQAVVSERDPFPERPPYNGRAGESSVLAANLSSFNRSV